MAKKEQAVLEVKIEQKSLIADLEKQKRSLISSKEELQKLNKAYKDGNVTLKEYASEAVRLEAIIKKQSTAYQNNQKAITGHKSKIDELIRSNDKLGSSFAAAAKDINIAGVNIGSLGTQMASFLTPAGAAVGIVTALGAAYARSTIGAKDLEFASKQLSAATTLLTNSFAELISSSEEGEGVLTGTLTAVLARFSPRIAAASLQMAQLAEDAEDVSRKESSIRADISDRLSENQEKLTEIAEEQTKYTDKIRLGKEILDNLSQNQKELVGVLKEQLAIIERQFKFDQNNEDLLDLKLKKQKEINKITSDTTKKIEAQKRFNANLTEQEQKRLEIERQKNEERAEAERITFSAAKIVSDPNAPQMRDITDAEIPGSNLQVAIDMEKLKSKKRLADEMEKVDKEQAEKEAQFRIKSFEIYKQIEEQKLAVAADIAGALSGLFGEQTAAYKVAASAETIISTYAGATKAFESFAGLGPVGVALGVAASAAAIVRGLANLAQINNVQFAEGGWTGPGSKYQAAGIVHADEYVTPKSVVNNPMAKPHLQALEAMRVKGYADGGFVTNQNTMGAQTSLAMINAMKNLPPQEVSVKEITRVQKRIHVREKATKIGGKTNRINQNI